MGREGRPLLPIRPSTSYASAPPRAAGACRRRSAPTPARPRPPHRSAGRTARPAVWPRPRPAAPRRSCARWWRSSRPLLEAGEILDDQLAVRRRVEVLLDQLGGRGDGQVHRFAAQGEQGLLLLGLDLLARPLQQELLLRPGPLQDPLPLLLAQGLRVGDDRLRLPPGVPQRPLVLLQQPRRLGPGPLGLVQLLLDAPLSILDRLENRRPAELPQQRQQQPEHHDRPENQSGIDGEGGEPTSLRTLSLLEQQRQGRHHWMSLKSSANTSAASPTPSMSAAVR